jgi:enamine deaminase RidA (YjgF/YER057c/UK114 family)
MAASPNLRFINPSTMSKPPGYTHVIEATSPGRIVYIAGQLGLTVDGKLAGPPGDFRAQATQAFENLKNALAAVGAGFEHVVKLNNYLTDIRAQLPIYRDVRDSFVSTANPPASTTLEVSNWRSRALSTKLKPSPCCRCGSVVPFGRAKGADPYSYAPELGRRACRIPLILQATRGWTGAGFDSASPRPAPPIRLRRAEVAWEELPGGASGKSHVHVLDDHATFRARVLVPILRGIRR